jgi:glucose-1-phosphate thymidylyltransferase
MNFKGIILAGGRGSRLSPLTDITNKFLMPVYDKLMIEYSVISLKNAGITDIAIILGTKSAGETMDYLKSGAKYGVKFTYFYQDEPLGVPHALYQAKQWAGHDYTVVMCADNILYDDLNIYLEDYKTGAYITVKQFNDVEQLKRFAVLEFKRDEHHVPVVSKLVEKPESPNSPLAFCGIQIYDNQLWDIIEGLEPSSRGEYEIVDVLNEYINRHELKYGILTKAWFDCGNKDALFEAQQFAYLQSVKEIIK